MTLDWKSLPDGKRKYQAYLASREWALKREAVKARSGGSCEHCIRLDGVARAVGTQTHHQSYGRLYDEPLEDLSWVCELCHLFLSGKSNHDPSKVLDDHAMFNGRKISSVYLAGKITGTKWRDEIAPGWSHENHSGLYDGSEESDDVRVWRARRGALPTGFGASLALTGPWWRPLDGAWCHANIAGSGGLHAFGGKYHGSDASEPDDIRDAVLGAISGCDLVFVWIDSLDCFGTLVEIGLAYGLRKKIAVAVPHSFNQIDSWLALSLADSFIESDSPADAWKILWNPATRHCGSCCTIFNVQEFYSDDPEQFFDEDGSPIPKSTLLVFNPED